MSVGQEMGLRIYTDGACLGNPGPGGWGFVVFDLTGKQLFEDSGTEANSTNNRMELNAAICAAEYAVLAGSYSGARPGQARITHIEIITDSKYVQQGVTTWIHGWVKNNWKGSNGKPIKNQDLWQTLHHLNQTMTIIWSWVKGHNGEPGNERADWLATSAAGQNKRAGQKTAQSSKLSSQEHVKALAAPTGRHYLNVPFSEKDIAKKLGARWDSARKQWYCSEAQLATLKQWA